MDYFPAIARWLHIVAGVTWVGLLYYFNLVGIGVGAWLGTIMLFNVWVLIWPNQQKILGLVKATDAEKASARRIALLASRTNMMLSLPMLFFMANGLTHRALIGL